MNGVGGHTTAEAQERTSRREFLVWLKYYEKHGPFSIMMRTKWGVLLVASASANVNKTENISPFKVSGFAPHINEVSLSLEEVMKGWD